MKMPDASKALKHFRPGEYLRFGGGPDQVAARDEIYLCVAEGGIGGVPTGCLNTKIRFTTMVACVNLASGLLWVFLPDSMAIPVDVTWQWRDLS